ncbi:hypothetical protein [Corallococcus terminator]|nr:hypothetical protein [Corallococcus terminator]
MTTTARQQLAARLGQAEAALQKAMREMDGSPAARTRLADSRSEYRAAEREALLVLGALEALAVVDALASPQ